MDGKSTASKNGHSIIGSVSHDPVAVGFARPPQLSQRQRAGNAAGAGLAAVTGLLAGYVGSSDSVASDGAGLLANTGSQCLAPKQSPRRLPRGLGGSLADRFFNELP
ncbi:hypothetical protein ACAW74_16520 [Fibrella sp. WM1]|uniref:hypothetical protein n=1 Tax=Fibrella musci TaxID=3242485 RepID=UPI003521542B